MTLFHLSTLTLLFLIHTQHVPTSESITLCFYSPSPLPFPSVAIKVEVALGGQLCSICGDHWGQGGRVGGGHPSCHMRAGGRGQAQSRFPSGCVELEARPPPSAPRVLSPQEDFPHPVSPPCCRTSFLHQLLSPTPRSPALGRSRPRLEEGALPRASYWMSLRQSRQHWFQAE